MAWPLLTSLLASISRPSKFRSFCLDRPAEFTIYNSVVSACSLLASAGAAVAVTTLVGRLRSWRHGAAEAFRKLLLRNVLYTSSYSCLIRAAGGRLWKTTFLRERNYSCQPIRLNLSPVAAARSAFPPWTPVPREKSVPVQPDTLVRWFLSFPTAFPALSCSRPKSNPALILQRLP
jgi:hypothetical protein